MRGKTLSQRVIFLALMFFAFLSFPFQADAAAYGYYNIGNPTLSDIWVDPNSGDDSHTGNNRYDALRTITAAWSRIPPGAPLATTGYRIMLVPGTYPCEPGPEAENCLNYFSDRFGTYQFPIIIRAADGTGTVTIRGGFNFNNVRYLYLIGLDMVGGTPLPVNISGNNLLHIALSDHVLLRGLSVIGPACPTETCNNLQEVLKVNQTQHLYVEQSTIGGAWHSSVDYMVVQHGHFLDNRIHTAGQWCMYVKGGSAYLRVEGNELYGCQLGFQAGQAANFAVMLSPWLHYEAYDVKFVNNILRDIPGVGMSVSGGYNILFAHNTLYRVATNTITGYGLTDFVHGERGCSPTDEVPNALSACNSFIAAGGWGPNFLTDSIPGIPNHNVFAYNNVFYNPAPQQTLYSHFDIFGSIMPPVGFQNIPRPSTTDDNLVLCGNVIWNGPPEHPIGNEEITQGCQPSNPTCNTTQLRSDNTINSVEPQLVNPSAGDYRPVPGGNIFSVATCAIPNFTWADAPASPAVPAGDVSNAVTRDRDSNLRTSSSPPGAYTTFNAVALAPVYRFWSDTYLHHFYTISEEEKNYVITIWPETWTYEGPVFYAYPSQVAGTLPVYRFWSDTFLGHFYTISETEKNYVIATWPDTWTYEGPVYYAYPSQVAGTLPLYRFWSNTFLGHFYTISETEKNYVIATWPDMWTYEGPVYYTYPIP
jgi:hypothetical protein